MTALIADAVVRREDVNAASLSRITGMMSAVLAAAGGEVGEDPLGCLSG